LRPQVVACILALLALGVGATTGQQAGQSGEQEREPFHDFRRQTLDYGGPEDRGPDPASADEIVIGWFGPADPADPVHGDLWTAASMAIEEANRDGDGTGAPLRLVPRWSENVWGNGVTQLVRLVYEDGARAILGSVDSAATHLAEQIIVKARLPLVSPVSTDESVNLAGVPWMFSVVPGDHIWAPTLAERVAAIAAEGPVALVTTTDHDSRLATEVVVEEMTKRDLAPAMRLDLPTGTTMPTDQLARLDLERLRAVLLVAAPDEGAEILLALASAGFAGQVVATPQTARRRCLDRAGSSADGTLVPLLVDPDTSAAHEDFAARFQERTGARPDWASAHTYDATRLLAAAIRKAGLSRTAIRRALIELSPWPGVTGPIEWDPTGQNQRSVTKMATVRDGRLVVE
jgi:ABC-type branched-subunit amino acid transport system substrate-binding protein